MIDTNIIPFGGKPLNGANIPLTTAARLYALAEKAEKNPEQYRYLLALTASGDLAETDWSIAGHPSILVMLGLLEAIKDEIHTLFSQTKNED